MYDKSVHGSLSFSYHSIVNIVSYFSASGVAAASDSVLSAVSSSAFAESPLSPVSRSHRSAPQLPVSQLPQPLQNLLSVSQLHSGPVSGWSLDRKAVIICDLDLLDQFFSSLISAFFFQPSVVSL